MEEKLAIRVKDLHIYYKVMAGFSIKKSLFRLKKGELKSVHAVDGISFEVKRGEILGILGLNGSGKSTTLRSIAGILQPDSGSVELFGNSITLLSLGVGFNREVSGRDNIVLSGMLLGFSEKEIMEKMDAIIEFSELGNAIDMPVRTYSSGMESKLSFAITAMLETDIVLIDEVLSVGDTRFRKKSYDKMKEIVLDEDRTAVIVSHQESTLRELCTQILWMEKGRIRMIGPTEEVLEKYIAEMDAPAAK
ncbi:MAG: ABC transporter ATP-binding protein [Clostridia bacterium]|nr:ABC transporter ATP-binding protein [Clostridia bacterium]